MDDLVQFLRARLDEDEQAARDAALQLAERAYAPVHAANHVEQMSRWTVHPWLFSIRAEARTEHGDRIQIATLASEHIALHNPARVLAEVDAKRQQLSEADSFCAEYEADTEDDNSAEQRADCWRDTIHRLLALPYADHPDYREEWRP